jgi:hypothetical protein
MAKSESGSEGKKMLCGQCGNNMESGERYCSKCGKDSDPVQVPTGPQSAGTSWDTHVRVLAWILIIAAFFVVIPSVIFLGFFGIFGRLFGGARHIFLVGPMFGFFSLLFLPVPIGIAAAGIGLLKYRDWARVLTLILAGFMVIAFPFGTALGIYAFWVLLSTEGSSSYKAHAAAS